ncbi:phage/plasmid primase, P4 family [Alicyclobacillus acidocaldarius subsp. acidocaldarius Tc-4-1]|uniref:Phage/plasmid primase, P4 family n=1 Tax=Alicyclobacillus acidocaldarius (strain Tc-4-1) TaxID=1048834 RepID=F8IDD9_ALIAT|nr:phage/plasmid primase, P4 family [Alicyclobacillus acidocaldarius subsp. acidocaldarius Tc-4-1]
MRLGEAAYELTRIRHVPDAKTGELVVVTSNLMDEYELEIQKAAQAVQKRWGDQKRAARR